jgi:hypothetical protein
MTDDIIDITTRPCFQKSVRERELEEKLRRAIARGTPTRCLSPQHEAALFIWRAAAVAENDPGKAADFLEMAAQRLRKGDGNEPSPGGA